MRAMRGPQHPAVLHSLVLEGWQLLQSPNIEANIAPSDAEALAVASELAGGLVPTHPQTHKKETEAHRCSLVVSTAASRHLSSERLKVHRASWLRQAKPTGRREGKG